MRAKPFSGKKKKQQLQEKRQRKAQSSEDDSVPASPAIAKQAKGRLVSDWDTRGIAKRSTPYENVEYTKTIQVLPHQSLEVSFDQVHGDLGRKFTLPIRPDWSYGTSKEELEQKEQLYFQSWLDEIYALCPREGLSYFEHNLEVWRQLWRVCEMSQVIVVVVDIRHPVLHFPPSLYDYVLNRCNRQMIIALTKTDLVAASVVSSWKEYILALFPTIRIVDASIYDLDHAAPEGSHPKRYVSATGIATLVQTLKDHSDPRFHGEWESFKSKRLHDEMHYEASGLDEKDYCTIGMIGHPNAGKSSLINSVLGKKVVSASRTPGHTKHFQTIHLSKHIRLCDCPGLIFPMKVPKWLQILSGLYNVAQVRDPYEPILHLMAHVDLPAVLSLPNIDGHYSVLRLCEDGPFLEFAIQRGFFTAKAARPDIYRAANMILRAVIDGRILLSWKPPGYYLKHSEEVRVLVASPEEEDDDSIDNAPEVSCSSDEDKLARVAATGGAFALLLDPDLDSEQEESD